MGFCYDLCANGYYDRNRINSFLASVATSYSSDVVYNQQVAHLNWADGSTTETVLNVLKNFNTVFLALPQRALSTNEVSAFQTFLQGFQKRLIVVGDRYSAYGVQDNYLNLFLTAIGSNLSISNNTYDSSAHFCSVVTHTLTAGVSGV